MINRTALIVRAKQPFLDWLKTLPDPPEHDLTLESVNIEPRVYLIPEDYDEEDEDMVLRLIYPTVSSFELGGWWTDPNDWPEITSLDLFKDWFDVRLHSVIEDLVDEPLIDEEF